MNLALYVPGVAMGNRYFFGLTIFLVALVFGCAQMQQAKQPELGAPVSEEVEEKAIEKAVISQPKVEPILKIISPKDGELIKNSKVSVELQAENFNIVAVGKPVKDGEGHFHVWLDSDKRVTASNAVTFENVVSGKYAIVAELVKSDHASLSPKAAKIIIVNVESDYAPKEEVQQAGANEFAVEADDNGFYPSKLQAKIGDRIRISFRFRDSSIYFAGLDIKGPFPDVKYKVGGQQPVAAEFTMKGETRITSWWPSSGVKKADLIVEVAK